MVPFPKIFPGTACSDGDNGCAVVDGSTGGSGLGKRKYLSLHTHSYVSYFVVLGPVLILSKIKLLYRCIGSADTDPDSHGFPRTQLY